MLIWNQRLKNWKVRKMTTINIFTENIFSDWKLDEKDIIRGTYTLNLELFKAGL